MKRKTLFLSILIALCGLTSSMQAQEKKSSPRLDINLRGGVGSMSMPHSLFTPHTAIATMTVEGWLNDFWKVGLQVSTQEMHLGEQSLLSPRGRAFNQLFVGPSISLNKRLDSWKEWGANATLSVGYTYLFNSHLNKKDTPLAAPFDTFNKAQHGWGLHFSVDLRRYIGMYYVGLGYALEGRMIKVESKKGAVSHSIGTPQLVFGIVL